MKIAHLPEGGGIVGVYRISYKNLKRTSKGDPYLSLGLADDTGEVEAKVWENAAEIGSRFEKGDVVRVQGTLDSYKGQKQVVVEQIEPASQEEQESLTPKSPRSLEEMEKEWHALVEQVENPHLRGLLDRVWNDDSLREALCTAPGGTKIHHPYQGGLLEHSLAVAKGAYLLWRKVYPNLDRDLLIAGGLLHDIGKTQELAWKGTEPEYTDEGRLLGHVMLGNQILARLISEMENFPPELAMKIRHIVASHHGEPEVGAAQRPMFKEAVVIHFLDEMDSKVSGFDVFIQRDQQEGNWTAYHRWFERYIYKG